MLSLVAATVLDQLVTDVATPPGGKPTVYIGVNDVGDHQRSRSGRRRGHLSPEFLVESRTRPRNGRAWDLISYAVDATGEPLVLFGTADPDSAVYAIDAVTGALVWRYAVYNPPPGVFDVGAGVTISPPGSTGSPTGLPTATSKWGTPTHSISPPERSSGSTISGSLDLHSGAVRHQFGVRRWRGGDLPQCGHRSVDLAIDW